MQSRIEVFSKMAQEQPNDEMIWYGLATEYIKLERWNDAVDALRRVISLKPDYTAAFQMLGTALMNAGEAEGARKALTDGIEVSNRTGAWKARQHMEGLLANVTEATAGEFCKE